MSLKDRVRRDLWVSTGKTKVNKEESDESIIKKNFFV